MARKFALTPLQGSIVQMLSEAGEENWSCVKATLKIEDDASLDEAIQELVRLDLVKRDFEPSTNLPSLVLTEKGHEALRV